MRPLQRRLPTTEEVGGGDCTLRRLICLMQSSTPCGSSLVSNSTRRSLGLPHHASLDSTDVPARRARGWRLLRRPWPTPGRTGQRCAWRTGRVKVSITTHKCSVIVGNSGSPVILMKQGQSHWRGHARTCQALMPERQPLMRPLGG
jgi:hypothetical protein